MYIPSKLPEWKFHGFTVSSNTPRVATACRKLSSMSASIIVNCGVVSERPLMDLESFARVLNRRSHQFGSGLRAKSAQGGFKARPETGHSHTAARRQISGREPLQPSFGRIHSPVHIGGLARLSVVVEQAEHASDGGHMRLDHRLRDRRAEGGVAGVAALLERIYRRTRG